MRFHEGRRRIRLPGGFFFARLDYLFEAVLIVMDL